MNRLRKRKTFTAILCGLPTLLPKQPLAALTTHIILVT
jgi:hypothetical protein